MGAVSDAIKNKLSAAFAPATITLVDESARHAGHAGASQAGESHFNLTIESPVFAGLGRLARQRRVMSVLSEELAGPIHALSIQTLAPGEV
jgi:BolA protein